MADNTQVVAGTGDTIRDKDRSGVKTQIVGLDLGVGGTESLMNGFMPTKAVVLTQQTGTVTTSSSTVVATTDVGPASGITVQVSGTYAGVNITFEQSVDSGTTWIPISGIRADGTGVIELTSGVLTANQSRVWNFSALAANQFRIRATAYTSGTANVIIQPTGLFASAQPVMTYNNPQIASTITGITAAAADTSLVAANPLRKGCRITNNSTATMYVREGGTAAITSGNYSFPILPNQTYEYSPGAVWLGAIRAIWSAANGYANITELT